jgi:hypothetical protein
MNHEWAQFLTHKLLLIGLQTLTAKTYYRQIPRPSNNYKQTLLVEEITFCLRPNAQQEHVYFKKQNNRYL